MTARFLQLHTLTSYAGTLLNRDDMGRAKRLPFGGRDRTRVSSQCLKRHWRETVGEWSLQDLATGRSTRSRRVFSDVIAGRLEKQGLTTDQIINVLTPLRAVVLGESAKAKQAQEDKKQAQDEKESSGTHRFENLRTPQIIVMGDPEIDFLTELSQNLAGDNAEETAAKVAGYFKEKETKTNLKALSIGSGIDAAIFGRMATSDLLARTSAAIHVAHSFTVHAEETEQDYFSAMDEITAAEGQLGSGHINTSELTSGVFYSYVAVDLPKLTANLSGDRALAAEVLRRLVGLVATVSPAAKCGATAPYACAELVAAEAGARQPRTLANAFRNPVPTRDAQTAAAHAIDGYLKRYDEMYGQHEERRLAAMIEPAPVNAGERVPLPALADWAALQAQEAA